MNFQKVKTAQVANRETNDCSVKAVSIACDVSYSVAHKALRLQGRPNGKGVNMLQIIRAVVSIGYSMERVVFRAKTVATIGRDSNLYNGYYIANVRGHVAAVVNGKVEDWTDGRRHKLLAVYKIKPVATRKERRAMINKMMVL